MIELLSIEAFIKRPFYWKELFKECAMKEVEPNDDLTLAVLMTKGILSCREKVEEISRRVDKCWNIEKKLNEMLDKMRLITFEVQHYKGCAKYIFIFRYVHIQISG